MWEDAATQARILATEKQTTETGAEIMTLMHPDSLIDSVLADEEEAAKISVEELAFDFIHSAQTGDAHQLKVLIDMKIDVNTQDDDGYPALILASCYGFQNAVAALLSTPTIKVNMMANDGCTALQVAAQDGFTAITKLLVAAKADLDLAAKGAAAPLFLASQEGMHCLFFLLSNYDGKIFVGICLPNRDHNRHACAWTVPPLTGHVPIVEFLADAKADVDKTRQSYTPLYIAAQEVGD